MNTRNLGIGCFFKLKRRDIRFFLSTVLPSALLRARSCQG